jgi:RNA polymerase sigma-70 factor (ECF subfamily)
MALSDIDRNLLERCLDHRPRAWEDFVDRYMGLVVHVVNHSAQAKSIRLGNEDREDLVGVVFLGIVKNDFAVLRHFRGQSSLATYLTVIARRIVVHELVKNKQNSRLSLAKLDGLSTDRIPATNGAPANGVEQRLSDRDQIQRLLEELDGTEAQIVRMYHLEGKSYEEISTAVGMPENSVGPTLSRARRKMRGVGHDAKTG